ncbi:CoA ester lyase [Microbacterium mitrae]|uniref:CoA ester lyase n=1 Tax=Microbacterium mitrae TaxID=664640 RepID=A0A5C8HP92_9MICO|nr:CoA ester lyase [Microbacterium mitrae]TXK04631.1 CoA ester lyase [Microbacterium mitrae]
MTRPPLTLLYTGADRSERIPAAWNSPADVVIFDLEDAVAPARKAEARENLRAFFHGSALRAVQVRINHAGSPWYADDLALISALPSFVEVRIPKVESAADVRAVATALPSRRLHLLIESALGLERAFDLATASDAVASIALGEADLRGDLRVDDDAGLAFARMRLVLAARAAGLPSPQMSVFANIRDGEGLAASCAVGRSLGFRGRTAIHPSQLPIIAAAFRPTSDEVARARAVLAAIDSAVAIGTGAVALEDGTFVDIAMIDRARETIELADASP